MPSIWRAVALPVVALVVASCSRRAPAPRDGEDAIDASRAEADAVLEDLPLLGTPKWPAPVPARDGSPVVLRAVRTNGRVILWGHGSVADARGLAIRTRFLDEGGAVLSEDAATFPVTPSTGGWYRVGFADRSEHARTTRVQAQVGEVLSFDGRSLWKPGPGYRWPHEWRYPWPSAVPAKLDGAPLAMAVLGKALFVGKDIFRMPKDPKPRVELAVGVYSLADVALTRVLFEVQILDREEIVGTASCAWLPRFGDDPVLSLPPRTWSQVVQEAQDGTPERLMAASGYRFKVTKVEGPGGVDIPLK